MLRRLMKQLYSSLSWWISPQSVPCPLPYRLVQSAPYPLLSHTVRYNLFHILSSPIQVGTICSISSRLLFHTGWNSLFHILSPPLPYRLVQSVPYPLLSHTGWYNLFHILSPPLPYRLKQSVPYPLASSSIQVGTICSWSSPMQVVIHTYSLLCHNRWYASAYYLLS